MERGQIIEHLKKLETAFGPKMEMKQKHVDLWCEMLKDCSEEALSLAVDKYIKECEFAPTVGGLMKYYRDIVNEHNEYAALVRRQYSILRSIWEEKEDVGTMLELYNFSMRYPEKSRRTLLIEYVHQACSFRHDCDACGRKDIPTIKEYIRGAR